MNTECFCFYFWYDTTLTWVSAGSSKSLIKLSGDSDRILCLANFFFCFFPPPLLALGGGIWTGGSKVVDTFLAGLAGFGGSEPPDGGTCGNEGRWVVGL